MEKWKLCHALDIWYWETQVAISWCHAIKLQALMSWSPCYVVIQPFGNYLVEFGNISLYFYVKSPFWYCHLIEYIVYIYLVWSSYGNLFHHLDWHLDLSFWIPSWDSKSVWISRPHISGWHTCQVRNVSSYNLILCLQVLSSHTFSGMRKLCITLFT